MSNGSTWCSERTSIYVSWAELSRSKDNRKKVIIITIIYFLIYDPDHAHVPAINMIMNVKLINSALKFLYVLCAYKHYTYMQEQTKHKNISLDHAGMELNNNIFFMRH